MAKQIVSLPIDPAAWKRGADLAFSMLREIEALSLDETAYEDDYRDHRPQSNVVAAYLPKLEGESPDCQLAFAAILTDYIASSTHSGSQDLDVCQERYAPNPIATALPVKS